MLHPKSLSVDHKLPVKVLAHGCREYLRFIEISEHQDDCFYALAEARPTKELCRIFGKIIWLKLKRKLKLFR